MQDVGQHRYDRTTVTLHWLTAVLVAVLWILGQTADYFPHGSLAKTGLWSTHVTLGFVLAAALVSRIVWRAGPGVALPAADQGVLHILAKATHYLLYLLLIGVVVLGIVNAFVRGYSMFDLFHLPQVGDPAWRRPITHWHGLVANALLALALFHALAALAHHYLWRDGLLRRMMPAPRRSTPPVSDALRAVIRHKAKTLPPT